MKKTILLLLILIGSHCIIFSRDLPRIPDGEIIRYKTTVGRKGEKIEYSNQSITIINDGGEEYYLVKYRSGDQISETKINSLSFIPLAMDITYFGKRSNVQRTTSLLKAPVLQDDEIALLDINNLSHVLRAYPFEDPRDFRILILGQGSEDMSSMSLRIEFVKEDTISLNNREIKTWKLEMKADFEGAMALFAGMVPKTYLWFSQDPSRHLVKMTSSRGMGSDNAIIQEMISYSP